MTYWLIFVVIGLGTNANGGSNTPSPPMHVSNFPSYDSCSSAAKEALAKNGNGSPSASYRFLCVPGSGSPPPQ